MRLIAEIVGWFTISFAILGAVVPGVDFRYCFAPTGQCFKGGE
jgi:hypothetical protein